RERGLRRLGGLQLLGDLVVLFDDLFQVGGRLVDLPLEIRRWRYCRRDSRRGDDPYTDGSDEQGAHQVSRKAQGLQSSLPVRGLARPSPSPRTGLADGFGPEVALPRSLADSPQQNLGPRFAAAVMRAADAI